MTAEGSTFIPVQEVITPLPGEQRDHIQTDTDAVMPYVPVNAGLNPDQEEDQALHIRMPEPIPYQHNQHSQHASPIYVGTAHPYGVEFTAVSPSGRTSPTSISESAIGDEGVDETWGLTRFESPVPTDELARQRRNERRYRLNIHHDYPSPCKRPFHPQSCIYHVFVLTNSIDFTDSLLSCFSSFRNSDLSFMGPNLRRIGCCRVLVKT